MGATLQALRALQDIELQIIDIRQQLARKQSLVAAQERMLAEIRRAMQEQRDRLHTMQREADAVDLDLKSRAEHVNRLRTQLNSARTNKEYAAVLQELNTQKADETKLESEAMEKLEAVERQKAVWAQAAESEKNTLARLEEARAEMGRTRGSLADRLATLQKQHDQAATAVPPAAARLFARTAEHYDGVAMARIARTHPRRDEFICDGCNMSVNPERFNAVMTRDEVQTCASCGRILYVDTSP